MKRIGILVSVALLLCMVHAIAFAELLSIPIGTGTTEDKPQSKLWFHDGDWWAIMPDGFHLYFYRMIDGVFIKQTFPSAMARWVSRKASRKKSLSPTVFWMICVRLGSSAGLTTAWTLCWKACIVFRV